MPLKKKIKKAYFCWQTKVEKLWTNGKYIQAVTVIVIPSAIIGLIIALIVKSVTVLFHFFRTYYPNIIFAGLIVWLFFEWLDNHADRKLKRQEKEREEEARTKYIARLDYEKTKEATYIEQGKIVFSVSRELGVLGIIPPTRLSNIYSPTRMIPKENHAFSLAQFLLSKDRDDVDTELLKQVFQTKIDQRLTAGEYPGIEPKHVYQGRVYSGLIVDLVRDSEGFVEIYTVLTNDAYCRYRQELELGWDTPAPTVDRRDVDY